MSLMAAGVPLKGIVSGIAMGLITNDPTRSPDKENNHYTILTDIQGLEDHFGDMDFKCAGTEKGITALQMDIKIHVHDLVDNVVAEAREAGKGAALYIEGKLPREDQIIACLAGDGIGYVVPQKIALNESDDNLFFKFRVRTPSKNVFVEYSFNGEVIKRVFKPVIIPSEMEIESLPKKLLKSNQGTLILSLKSKEA